MKDTKRRLMTFTFYDRSGIERELEEQAAQGWMLEKTSAAGWVYRRIEPAKIHFAVVYFPAASAFDPHPSEDQQRFQEFCEHTGWELIASNIQLQIFCNRNENPIPIETDPVIELENIHASVKKSVLQSYAINLILAIIQIGLAFQRFSLDAIGELASTFSLLSLLFWVMMIFSCVTQILLYFRWYNKAKSAARNGIFLETQSTDKFQIIMLISSALALVFLLLSVGGEKMLLVGLLMIVGIVSISLMLIKLTNLLKKKNVSAKMNKIIIFVTAILAAMLFCGIVIWLMVSILLNSNNRNEGTQSYEYNGHKYYIYQDKIPLRIEDLLETDYEGYSYQIMSDESSPLLHRYEARQKTRYDALAEPEMYYHVIEVKVPFLYNRVLELMKEDFDHNYAFPEDDPNWEEHVPVDSIPWGAKKAYQLVLGGEAQYRYLLCYERCIIEIDFDWEPDAEQMAIVGEKLNCE